jgi:hypothetical protein
MKKLILIFLCLCVYSDVFSQFRKVEKLEKDRTPSLKLSYLSRFSLKSPGVSLGAEFMMQRKTVALKNFVRTKEKFLTVNFSIFDEPNLNGNMALYAEWLKRTRYAGGGFFTEAAVGFGGSRMINYISPSTYVKAPDGTESIKKPDLNFIMVALTTGLGYDFNIKQKKPIKLFGRMGLYPTYAKSIIGNLFFKVEVGAITSLSTFKKK